MFPEQGGLEYDAGVRERSLRKPCFALPGNDAVVRTAGGRSPQPASPTTVHRECA